MTSSLFGGYVPDGYSSGKSSSRAAKNSGMYSSDVMYVVNFGASGNSVGHGVAG